MGANHNLKFKTVATFVVAAILYAVIFAGVSLIYLQP